MSIFSLFKRKKELPLEGSTYTIKDKKSAYYGMTGIVEHHLDKERFMINCGHCWVVNIKP